MAVDLLPQLLDEALSRGVDQVEVVQETVDFGDLAGPEYTAERTAFAELLAGTTDKKSRAYKAQRRNVERWVKGRRPMTISVQRIVSARRQQSRKLAALRQAGADVRLTIRFYGERKPERLPPGRWLHIPREVMRRVVRTWADGDATAAAHHLRRSFYEQYGVPNVDDWLRDVIVTGLELDPGR